jgi:hypothetical protein
LAVVAAACGDDDGGAADGSSADARVTDARPDAAPSSDGTAADASGPDVTPASGDVCATAEAITAGTLTGQTTVGYLDDYDGSDCTGYTNSGPDRAYAIAVPAGQVLTARVLPAETMDAVVYLVGSLSDCGAPEPACADWGDYGSDGDPELAQVRNDGATELTVYVIVDSYTDVGDTFTLETSLATPPTTGDQCLAPDVLTTSGVTAQTTVGYTDDYDASDCTGYGAPGFDRVYTIAVPGTTRLSVTLTPATTDDMAVYLVTPLASCTAAPTCVGGADDNIEGEAETAEWLNQGSAPETVYVVADSYYRGGFGFDLGATLTAASAGEVCANAIAIGPSETVAGASGESGEYDAVSTCTGFGTMGVDRVYTTAIAAGTTLTATVTPVESTADPAIYILAADGCTATPSCLAGSDTNDEGLADSASYMNAGVAPITVYIVVDSWYTAPFTFNLTTSTI